MRCLFISLLLSALLALPTAAAEVQLSVASSMTDATRALIAAYRQQDAASKFLPNFASSGALAKQLAQGAPADLFISANPRWMDYLVEQRRIAAEQVRPFAGNGLVVVGAADAGVGKLSDLAKLQRIAIGSPGSVPAGQYSAQALRAAGLYDQLQTRLVLAQNVRQALLYADRGAADAAFVYRTDAALARQAVVLFEVPQALYDPITYPAALTITGEQNPAAKAFFAFLGSDQAAAILRDYGFTVP